MPDIQSIIDEFDVIYAVLMSTDGSNWEEYGDAGCLKYRGMVSQYFPGPEIAGTLDRMLTQAVDLPQIVSQGDEHCVLTKPSAGTIAGLFLSHTGNAVSLFVKAEEIQNSLLKVFKKG